MTIKTYKNTSDVRRLSKTLQDVATFDDVVLLTDVDNVTTPIFVFSGFDKTANYLYSADFGRYYYIRNIAVTTGNRYKVECAVDVLMSFADNIRAAQCIVDRSNSAGNVLVADGLSVTQCNDTLTNIAFSGGEILGDISAGNVSFLLYTYGGVV